MPSERIQKRIDALLDEADEAVSAGGWPAVAEKARAVLSIDANNEDARAFLGMAVANGISETAHSTSETAPPVAPVADEPATEGERAAGDPESFAGGRYKVLRFLGEGGKKRVFLAHDTLLDRDIAFSLIKTEGLDEVGRQRIMREAQAMGRLTHQNIVSIYDIGEHVGPDGTKQPYLVQELMGGGDVEMLLEDADAGLPLKQALDIATATARGLEFAHAQGVVHRDLKPGNVWLTEDGVAKIGDLGLAVTLGQSRLTTHGMMVGTYGYMPPEQALGQEVTAQADLYSLGAMLYELVTGRPPFRGDTPTAVISQHLNTQPVAPSWHSDHCPPDLEALILHLLAKVPADRPASATEVIAALIAVDPEGRSSSHSDSQTNPLDRLARGVFVGREHELEQLRESLDGALQGRGSVVMLVGEPGIGKTRAVQELETYARMRGAEVYWGRTHESAGMPAYWPWRQIGTAWGAQQDFNSASIANAVANPELQHLFPDLRQVVPTLPEPPEPRDPESAQFLMFDAWTQFMRAQSASTPWVVVLDDLHWSDKPTFQLLQYAARELANMNVLIVGTYRDTDLVRTHPLSETLAELNRESGFVRIPLKGLSRDEVASYVHQRAGTDPVPALIDRLYQETEGNPFFLSEMVNLMVDEGTLDSTSVSDMALPDGVREALGRRLDRLSEDANELLQTAAVVGREFAHETLDLLSEHDADALLGLIEEGLRARVIEEDERPGRYRFTHALMQETLLDELSTTRRVRLHGRIGEVLERRWGDRADEFATRLAAHFVESATLTRDHAAKAVQYSRLSAEQAEAQFAWDEAARHYESCLTLVSEDEDRLGEDEAALHEALGRCELREGQIRAGWRNLMRAITLFRDRDDAIGQARVVLEVPDYGVPPERLAGIADTALEMLGDRQAHLRARLLATRALTELAGAEEAAGEAASLAATHDFKDVQASLLHYQARSTFGTTTVGRTQRLFQDAHSALASDGDPGAAASALAWAVFPSTWGGRLDEAETLAHEAVGYARSVGAEDQEGIAGAYLAHIALLRCDFERFEELAAPITTGSGATTIQCARASFAEMSGVLDRAIELLPEPEVGGSDPMSAVSVLGIRAGGLLRAGRHEAARQAFDQLVEVEPRITSAFWRFTALGNLGTAAAELGDDAWVRQIYDEYTSYAETEDDRLRVTHAGRGFDVVKGALALRLDVVDEAEQHYRSGLGWCERERCPVEAGRCHQGLAEVAERRGHLESAQEHLDAAGVLFSQHGAKLYLDQVIAKKEILKA